MAYPTSNNLVRRQRIRRSRRGGGENRKGEDDDRIMNSGGGAKSGKKMRRDINRPVSKGINEDNPDSWDKHKFDGRGEEGAEWETSKGLLPSVTTRTTRNHGTIMISAWGGRREQSEKQQKGR